MELINRMNLHQPAARQPLTPEQIAFEYGEEESDGLKAARRAPQFSKR